MQVNAAILLKLGRQVLDKAHIKVFTAEEGIAIGSQHLKLFFAIDIGNFNDRYIKGTTAKVVNCDHAIPSHLVNTIGQCRSSWLINDALDI